VLSHALLQSQPALAHCLTPSNTSPHTCLPPPSFPFTPRSGFCAYYTSEYTGRAAILKSGGLAALIDLLVAIVPDAADLKAAPAPPDLARNTVRALGVLFDDYDARAAIGDAGGLESLMVLLDSEYPELQSLSLAALAKAAQNKRNQMIVRVCGGLEKLLGMVSKAEYASCHSQVLKVLGELLVDPVNMAVVSERGAPDKQNPQGTAAPIEAVKEFVQAGDNETRAQALWCVARAAGNEDNRRLLMDLKIEVWTPIPPFLPPPRSAHVALARTPLPIHTRASSTPITACSFSTSSCASDGPGGGGQRAKSITISSPTHNCRLTALSHPICTLYAHLSAGGCCGADMVR